MPINFEKFREMRTVTLSNGDRFRFQWTEPSTLIEVIKIRDKELSDREYLNRILTLLIENPDPIGDKVDRLSEKELFELLNGYLNLKPIAKDRNESVNRVINLISVANARTELDKFLDAETERLAESTKDVMDSLARFTTGFSDLQGAYNINPLWNQLDSVKSLLNIQTGVTEQLSRMAFDSYAPLLESIQRQNKLWANSWINAQSGLNSMYSQIINIQETMQDSIAAMMRSISAIDLPSVIRGWDITLDPSLIEWAEEIREEHRSAFLIDTNLQFLSDMSDQAIAEIVDDLMDTPPATAKCSHYS